VRWYASCCSTPIGNTLVTRQVSFVGLIHRSVVAGWSDRARGEAIGPVRGGVQARFAQGDRARLDAHDDAPLAQLFRFVPLLRMARMRGDHKRNPFFDPETGELTVAPRVLSPEELASVEAVRDA
jgi:hypothetical protein